MKVLGSKKCLAGQVKPSKYGVKKVWPKLGQKQLRFSCMDKGRQDKCCLDKCCLDKCHCDSWHLLKMVQGTYL